MEDNIPRADWQQHDADDRYCRRCTSGFPQPCPCGGQVHGELLNIPGDGFIQLSRCERCQELKDI